jgi:hypothetical protein
MQRLGEVIRLLEDRQESDGGWPADWAGVGRMDPSLGWEGIPATRIRVTGHHLEWIAVAPKELRPSDASVSKAIRFLQETMSRTPGDTYYAYYNLMTHAARALVLFSGREPVEVLKLKTSGN